MVCRNILLRQLCVYLYPMKLKNNLYTFLLLFIIINGVSAQNNYKKFDLELLDKPQNTGKAFERKFNSMTISKFEPDSFMNFIILENGYSKAKIANAEAWPPKEKKYRVAEIQAVYTQYPKDKDFWLTNYHDLLAERLKELFKLDPTLNDKRIEWTMVLQTACNSEKDAQKMFHGFAIYYAPVIDDTIKDKPKSFTKIDSVNYSKGYADVQKFVRDNVFAKERREADSAVFKTFDRHPDWKRCLVVTDWTSSMYAYGSQAALWHSLNYKRSGIKHFALFNDGGEKGNIFKRIGKVGSVFYCDADNVKNVVKTYTKVMENGTGGDEPENDVEAILRAIKRYPEAKEIVLIADNSCIRDFCLVSRISKPVRVILCGAKKGINPQYINLAYRTGGSIHTIEDDIEDLRKVMGEGKGELKIEDFEFIYNSDKNGFDFKANRPQTIPDCEEYNSKTKCAN